jgi:hypothetical protein
VFLARNYWFLVEPEISPESSWFCSVLVFVKFGLHGFIPVPVFVIFQFVPVSPGFICPLVPKLAASDP